MPTTRRKFPQAFYSLPPKFLFSLRPESFRMERVRGHLFLGKEIEIPQQTAVSMGKNAFYRVYYSAGIFYFERVF